MCPAINTTFHCLGARYVEIDLGISKYNQIVRCSDGTKLILLLDKKWQNKQRRVMEHPPGRRWITLMCLFLRTR